MELAGITSKFPCFKEQGNFVLKPNYMCSILAFTGKFKKELVTKLLENSRLRGVHAFGYSFLENDQFQTKKFLQFDKFLSSVIADSPTEFICHFRYSTSGDYKQVENNQPLFDGETCIAFNGVISQGTKEEMEKEFGIKLLGDNDGYVLQKKIYDLDFLKGNITFAMVGIDKESVFCMRNEKRPLWISQSKELTIVASTNDILKRSGVYDGIEVKPLNLYRL